MGKRLEREFFRQDVLEVAPALLGKHLVRVFPGDRRQDYVIMETEAYRGGEDRACHASKGRTPRTEVMFGDGGFIYMYLVYGMHWMLNVVTAPRETPQAVLVRGLKVPGSPEETSSREAAGLHEPAGSGADGPGKLTRLLQLDRGFYGEDLVQSGRIWIEESGTSPEFRTGPRIGIDYAGDPWKEMPWRFLVRQDGDIG